jgi:tetratricopeptide (TPR) repeat protein
MAGRRSANPGDGGLWSMRIRSFLSSCLLGASVLSIAWIGAPPAEAQIPDEFTNLKVLPKEISKRELVSIMRNFAGSLGVRCSHCHVGESTTSLEGFDFASDEPEPKRVAREMMKMTRQINDEALPATERKSLTRVRCVTCHRGLEEPETLDKLLLGVVEEEGVAAAQERYRELREKYYGSGSYDFSAGALNRVAETLAQEKSDVDGAIAVMKLNLEFNPDAAYSHLMLGQFYATKGDKEAAVSAVERSLELEPDNQWAKRMLERVKASE